jgi:hypothetical protein
MAELIYSVDVKLDRTGFDIVLNDIPAEHAKSTHRLKMPINEYIREGGNKLVLEASLWGSNAAPETPAEVTVKVTCDQIANQQIVGSDLLIDTTFTLDAFPAPGGVIFEGYFEANQGADLDLVDFSPIGPAEEQAILKRLQELSEALQTQDADVLQQALARYFARYEAAYGHVESGEMAQAFDRMLQGMRQAGVRVTFDPQLRPRRGRLLVDCLGPNGAAIRAVGGPFPEYDFWLVMGYARGAAVIVA